MEEERLLLLKETKEHREKNRTLTFENEDYREKISIFEKELLELKQQVREQLKHNEEEAQINESEVSNSVISSS